MFVLKTGFRLNFYSNAAFISSCLDCKLIILGSNNWPTATEFRFCGVVMSRISVTYISVLLVTIQKSNGGNE